MQFKNSIVRLVAAAAGAAAISTAAPWGVAVAVADSAPSPWACTGQTAKSSDDGWMSARFVLCSRTTGSTINVELRAADIEYYWGGAWYNNRYPVTLSSAVTITRDGRTVDYGQISQGSARSDFILAHDYPEGPGGQYTVSVQPSLTGGYWHDKLDFTNVMSVSVLVSP